MTKTSIRSFSILGLLLITVSAVTAAILATNNKSSKRLCANPGRLQFTNNGCFITCVPGVAPSEETVCALTLGSGTTGAGIGSKSNCSTLNDC